jgi:predicted RNase H-like HicB family nuclease
MRLTAVFEPADEGGYVCWFEEMPSVHSQGDTMAEARANLLDALKLAVEYLRERARRESSPQSVREIVEAPALRSWPIWNGTCVNKVVC